MRYDHATIAIVAVAAICCAVRPASAQNIVTESPAEQRLEPVTVKAADVDALLAETPDFSVRPASAEAQRTADKLDAHVAEFLAGFPWKAFHNTLGISGYETYFNHPDDMFWAIAISLPYLKADTASAAKRLLAAQLAQYPPFAVEGFRNLDGRPREAYDVPDGLRTAGRGRAASAFGVYAFWAYCRWAGDAAAARQAIDAVKERMRPVLVGQYQFDAASTKYTDDEAERLTGDLSGCIGLARLARMTGQSEAESAARERARMLLELRVNLDRVNPRVLQPTKSATKHLHNVKLARYCRLAPEVGRAVARLSDGVAAARVQAVRLERPVWWMAFAERLVGGENYVTPPHVGRALMASATFIEELPGEQLLGFVDVPWCKGDFGFIEKCVYALWASAGRPWTKAE